jgi:hypothetical protein
MQAEAFRVLVDGVPRKLLEPLLDWMKPVLWSGDDDRVSSQRTQPLELMTDVPIGIPSESWIYWDDYSRRFRKMDDQDLLRIVDAILATDLHRAGASNLEGLLRLAKSKWSVGERQGKPGLVTRQPEGVQDMMEATITGAGTAGQILGRAWGKVHALTPDDAGAYADAVRAVEIAAQKLIEPNNSEATLGSMSAVVRNQGDWRLPLREHDHAPANEMLVYMMRSLYRGHIDRHGRDDYRDVTHEEALAGVSLAATLVSWLASGLVTRTD